jgi:hypothetical protein
MFFRGSSAIYSTFRKDSYSPASGLFNTVGLLRDPAGISLLGVPGLGLGVSPPGQPAASESALSLLFARQTWSGIGALHLSGHAQAFCGWQQLKRHFSLKKLFPHKNSLVPTLQRPLKNTALQRNVDGVQAIFPCASRLNSSSMHN